MIVIENISKFNFTPSFNQTQDLIINSLESEFINRHGSDFFRSCSLIIVIENENFYHVIRNKHKVRVSGELMSNLLNDLSTHL